jgi:hypothetical protein
VRTSSGRTPVIARPRTLQIQEAARASGYAGLAAAVAPARKGEPDPARRFVPFVSGVAWVRMPSGVPSPMPCACACCAVAAPASPSPRAGSPVRRLPLAPAPAALPPDRRAPRRSEAEAAARRTAAGEIVIAAASRGRLLHSRAGPLRAARRVLRLTQVLAAGAACEGAGTDEAAHRRRGSDALRRGCFAARLAASD